MKSPTAMPFSLRASAASPSVAARARVLSAALSPARGPAPPQDSSELTSFAFHAQDVTWSVSYVCLVAGKHTFACRDRATNFWPSAILSLGESWA